ncbi:MAG: two-component regulator propeller domain-containing protein [Chitinophagaceae bacterium]
MSKLTSTLFVHSLILVVALLLTGPVTAQKSQSEPYNFVYRKWNNESGLPQNTVYDMVRDSAGYLWGATEEGLFRFDGTVFSLVDQSNTRDLLSHTFYDLLPVGRELWASGRTNIIRFRNKVEKIWDIGSMIRGGWIRCIEKDDRNRVWIGTSTGRLFYIEDDSIHIVPNWVNGTGGSVEAMMFNGKAMMVGTGNGLYRIDSIGSAPVMIPQFRSIAVSVVIAGAGGDTWIGTENKGLYNFKTDTVHYTTGNGLRQNSINSLCFDLQQRLWIGFQSAGYQLLENGIFINPGQSDYEHDGIRSILVTNDAMAWLGTNSSGLLQLRPAQIGTSPAFMGLNGKILLGIYQHPGGEIWAGSAGRGVTRIVDGKVTEYNQSNGLSGNLVLSITGRGDYIYVGTANGLDRFNRLKGSFDKHYGVEEGLQHNAILAMLRDSDGRIWITTRNGGLHRMDSTDKITPIMLPAGLGQSNLISLFEDSRKMIWVGSRNAGMFRIDHQGEVVRYDREEGLMSDIVYSFFEDRQQQLWLGTDKGLVAMVNGKFRLFNTFDGLRFNEVYRILEDSRGYLWLSGNIGVQRIFLNDLLNAKNYGSSDTKIRSRLFNASDGMPNSETNGGFYPAGWKMLDGTLWFPTAAGAAVVDDQMISEESNDLGIQIQSLRYADQEFFQGQSIRIPPGVSNFEIRYTSIDFSKASDIRYFYRLKGFSDDWTPAGNRHIAYFSVLAPGDYVFEVRAERYGYFSPTASMGFTVNPYFYQTFWFKALMVILSIMAVVGAILWSRFSARRRIQEQQRITMAQIHGQEKERQFISAELHDSVNQQLTTAKLFLDFAKSNPAMSSELMLKSEGVIQGAIANIRTLCNSLTPPSLKDIGLREALEDLVHSYTSVGRFKVYWNFHIDPSDLSEELKFNLYRITQEQMQNIVRHSRCNHVWLDFVSNPTHLLINIRDDGKGFDLKTQRYGLGFANIRNRLVLYNGKMDLKSSPGKGCSIQITIPITKLTQHPSAVEYPV